MHDLRISGGLVIDGSGSTGVIADVWISGGRIAAIGDTGDRAARTIAADGRVVCPGFVDVHTHIDAQAFWDPDLSPAPLHGVTTALAGNCGFSIAPLSTEAGEYLMRMLGKVEGMPLESLRDGVPWDWTSTSDYLDCLDGTLAINTGFMVGHSALRRVVMGAAANERTATGAEIESMGDLLRAGLAAGGLGFSTTTSPTHVDADGVPVPSRFAAMEELVRLAAITGEFAGTSLELLPRGALDRGPFDDETAETMIAMSIAAGRPLNWNVISVGERTLDDAYAKLALGDLAAARGAKVVALTMPVDMLARFSFHAGFVLEGFDGWAEVMNASTADKLAAFADPDQRRHLEAGASATPRLAHLAKWGSTVIVETFSPETQRYAGRSLDDIAAELACSPFDALAEIALTDQMRTTFARRAREATDADWRARHQIWSDPRALVGASDTGAHLDMIAAFRYSTEFIAEAVRQRNLIPIERAIFELTGRPADLYGLRGVGRIAIGGPADVLVVDVDSIGSGPLHTRFDLPGGAGRLYAAANGIDHVFVNGAEIVEGGAYTGARAGRMLRSGVDSLNPSMSMAAS